MDETAGKPDELEQILPFSFPQDGQPKSSRIPSSLYSRPPTNSKLFLTKSRNLSENAPEPSVKRSSLFYAPSDSASQRTRLVDTQKPRHIIGSKIPVQSTENRLPFHFGGSEDVKPLPKLSHQIRDDPADSYAHQQFVTQIALQQPPSRSPDRHEQDPESTKYRKISFFNPGQSEANIPFESTPSRTASRHSDDIKRPRSRSSSVMPPYGTDPDISALLMLGATNVQNGRAELAEQRRENAHLKNQLDIVTREKAELARRFESSKVTTRKVLETSSSNYEDILSAFNSLKVQSQKSFAFVDEARVTLSCVKEIKERATETIKAVEPLLDEGGVIARGAEMKAVIRELQSEYNGAQQVNDLLRDKLHTIGGDLAEAKHRISELEANQIKDGGQLNRSVSAVLASSMKIEELMDLLKKREAESIDILRSAAEVENNLLVANTRIETLTLELSEKDARLDELKDVTRSNLILKAELDNKNSRITNLESLYSEASVRLSELNDIVRDKEVQVQALQEKATLREENGVRLMESLKTAEARIEEGRSVMLSQLEELNTASARESAALSKSEERAERVKEIETELSSVRDTLAATKEMLLQTNARFEVLQERFEDQSVTLRITKDLTAELQERLVNSEATYASKLESNTGKLKLEIAVLQEQKTSLEACLSDVSNRAAEDLRLQRLAHASAISDNTRIVQAEERRASRAEKELDDMKNEINELKRDLREAKKAGTALSEKLVSAQVELEAAKTRALEDPQPSHAQVEENDRLKERIKELECVNESLVDRAKRIVTRHKEGDLSDEEKAFINSLIQMSQSIHEEQLIAKSNELRRRDNTIKTLQSRIGGLESKVARFLQEKARTEHGSDGNSMIVLKNFMSSSPHDAGGPFPVDSDMSTTVHDQPQMTTMADQTVPKAKTNPTHASPTVRQESQRTFAQLAADELDDIINSEDDIPLSESLTSGLGKRERTSSPLKDLEMPMENVVRPNRRLKTGGPRKPDPQPAAENKPAPPTSKAKGKRQRR